MVDSGLPVPSVRGLQDCERRHPPCKMHHTSHIIDTQHSVFDVLTVTRFRADKYKDTQREVKENVEDALDVGSNEDNRDSDERHAGRRRESPGTDEEH